MWFSSWFLLGSATILNVIADQQDNHGDSVECQLYIKDYLKVLNLRKNVLYLKRGEFRTLACAHPNGQTEDLRWKLNNINVQCDKNCHSIPVRNPGNYTCVSNSTSTPCKAFQLTVVPIDTKVVAPAVTLTNATVDNVTIRCDPSKTNSGKNFSVTWKYENRPLLIGGHIIMDSENEFHIKKPKPFDSGIYLCTFTYLDGTPSEQNIVHLYSAPGISKYQRLSKDADEGGSVVFGCDFFGHPLPTVRWTRGKETPLLAQPDSVEFGPYDGIQNATVKMSNLKNTDRDDYICHGVNRLGEATFATLVRVKSKLAPLWPFLGILLEVIVLVAIILLFERRRKMKAAEHPDDDIMDSSKRSCQSTPDTDLRLRKK